jgi:hypothetical protein
MFEPSTAKIRLETLQFFELVSGGETLAVQASAHLSGFPPIAPEKLRFIDANRFSGGHRCRKRKLP